MSKDYYDILGVNKLANENDIKKAYRDLCVKWHPDKAPQDDEKKKKEYDKMFRDITEAYTVLMDPDKRKRYDHPERYPNGVDQPVKRRKREFTFGTGMGDLFSTFFGDMGSNFHTTKRSSTFTTSSSTNSNFDSDAFEKAFDIPFFKNNTKGFTKNGGTTKVKRTVNYNYDDSDIDDMSDDFDIEDAEDEDISRSDNTYGILNCTVNDLFNGNAIKYNYTRKVKRGNRLVNSRERLQIEIPEKHDISDNLIVDNMGSVMDKDLLPGDLELRLNVKPYKNYSMVGDQLVYTLDIDIRKAVKGFTKTIKYLDGEPIRLVVDPITNSGHTLEIEGKGMYDDDLIIKFNIDLSFLYEGDESDEEDGDSDNSGESKTLKKKPAKKVVKRTTKTTKRLVKKIA